MRDTVSVSGNWVRRSGSRLWAVTVGNSRNTITSPLPIGRARERVDRLPELGHCGLVAEERRQVAYLGRGVTVEVGEAVLAREGARWVRLARACHHVGVGRERGDGTA